MKIKKILPLAAFVLSLLLLFSACQKGEDGKNESTVLKTSSSVSSSKGEDSVSSSGASEKASGFSEAEIGEKTEENSSKTEPATTASPETKKYEPKSGEKGETAVSSRLRLLSLGVSGSVMCAEVKNVSNDDIEYCLLKASSNGKTAEFVLSVLPKGETAVVFEKNNKKFSKTFLNASWSAEEELLFEEPLEKMEDTFEINCFDGALEIKNKTASDITETIYICYKTVLSNGLDGSVSFRMRLGGLKSGETKQLFSENVRKNSKVIYVKYGN